MTTNTPIADAMRAYDEAKAEAEQANFRLRRATIGLELAVAEQYDEVDEDGKKTVYPRDHNGVCSCDEYDPLEVIWGNTLITVMPGTSRPNVKIRVIEKMEAKP